MSETELKSNEFVKKAVKFLPNIDHDIFEKYGEVNNVNGHAISLKISSIQLLWLMEDEANITVKAESQKSNVLGRALADNVDNYSYQIRRSKNDRNMYVFTSGENKKLENYKDILFNSGKEDKDGNVVKLKIQYIDKKLDELKGDTLQVIDRTFWILVLLTLNIVLTIALGSLGLLL